MKRLLVWAIRACGLLLWGAGVVGLAGWAFGRVVTDLWMWSQYLFWIPSVLAVPGATLAVGLGVALARGALRARGVRPSGRERRAAWASAAFLVGSAGYVVGVEYRWLSPAPEPATTVFRAVHWNASGEYGAEWDLRLGQLDPDLLVINPGSYQPWERLEELVGHVGGPTWGPSFYVLSKFPVLRSAWMTLEIEGGDGIDPRFPDHLTRRTDPGRAMFLELDTRAKLGRTLTVWCLDLPSDVSLPRRRVTEQAARAIARFHGTVSVRDGDGRVRADPLAGVGFPPPDLILGDMNIPRGSLSLARLAGACEPAYAQAGSGPNGTWPYRTPLFHLDQMFIAPWLRAVWYGAVDLGGGTHRAQRADLTTR